MNTTHLLSFRRFAAGLAVAVLTLGAVAQPPVAIKRADKAFIEKAARAGLEEIEISRVALERTQNTQVKSFAQMIVDDHTTANTALASMASNKGVGLPAKDLDEAQKWAKRNGKNFDEDYVAKMISAHKEAVDLFAKEANEGDDPEITAFARVTLPKLQHHLEMAMDLKKMMK